MKIQTKKSKKKLLIAIGIILLALCLAGAAYAYTQKLGPFKNTSTTKSTTNEEKSSGAAIKKNSLENSNNQKGSSGSDPLPEPTPSSDGGKATVGMEITAANQNESVLNIRTLIQTISSEGSCLLKMTGSNGNGYTAMSDIQAMPSSSTCKGFDVPTANLTTGEWTIVISFENEDVKGSATKEVEIK